MMWNICAQHCLHLLEFSMLLNTIILIHPIVITCKIKKEEKHFIEKLLANIRFEKSLVYSSPCHQHQNQHKDSPGKQAVQKSVTVNKRWQKKPFQYIKMHIFLSKETFQGTILTYIKIFYHINYLNDHNIPNWLLYYFSKYFPDSIHISFTAHC